MTEVFNFLTDVFGDYIAMAPLILLIVGALLTPLVFMLVKNKYAPALFALVFVILTFAVEAVFITEDGATISSFEGLFVVNTFAALMSILFLIVAALVIWISIESPETTKHRGEFYSILLIAIAGMIAVASSTNLLTIFIGVETVSIMSYAMVSMKKNDPRASEAAVKYLIIGGLSSALTLFGLSMLYGLAGTLEISKIGLGITEYSAPLLIAFVCLIAGWGFKISAVPFHAWAPDVYEGAASPVSAFLAVGSKKMGFVVFFKLFVVLAITGAWGFSGNGDSHYIMRHVFAVLAILTMTLGNIVAIQQTNIKRFLAYSSIAQAGYILIALAVMSQYAMAAGMFHMFTHVVMKGGLFVIVTALIAAGIGENISDLKGLAKRAPFIAFATMLFLFSLAGIPPLAGFTSKFFLFSSTMIYTGDGVTWPILLIFALINSAISLYYYAKIVRTMYIDKPAIPEKIKIKYTHLAAIIICVVFVLVLGLYPTPFFDWCLTAADSLFFF